MSKVAKAIGKIAGIVAVVAPFFGPVGMVVGAIAGAVAVVAGLAAQALAKPPPARGSVTQMTIQTDPPQPYVMGEGYYAGVLRYRRSYGATLKKVPNPYRFMAVVYSGGGPVQSISPRVDFEVVGGWYSGFLWTDVQTGACPEADALAPHFAGAPAWGSASKLSGQAAIGWSFLFDKDGKRFASGLPLLGAEGQWVKVYDPRLDSTFPGGTGSHRLGIESTYTWSENPALHAGTYAYGRYQNGNGPRPDGTPATGKRVMGMGLPADGIDWNVVAAWANVCDANEWTMFGVVYEGVGAGEDERRLANLKDICFAGGGEPVIGGVLSFRYSAPVVALDTITEDDLVDRDQSVVAMQSYRDRINIVIPKYRSAAHNWELVDAEPVVDSALITEDGEERRQSWPFNFVTDKDQAAQLAAYRIRDSRELAPITLVCKPRLRLYRPGECLTLDLPELGLDTDAIILRREIDPKTLEVTLTLTGETTAKHAFCLGKTGVAPPTPAIGQTAQERDELAAAAGDPTGYDQSLILASSQSAVTISATDTSITIGNHSRIYADKTVAVTGDTVTTLDDGTTALNPDTRYYLYYDDATRAGGAVAWKVTTAFFTAQTNDTHPARHYGGWIRTDVSGGGGTSGGGSLPPGSGGIDPYSTL